MRTSVYLLLFLAGFIGGTLFPSYSQQYQQRMIGRFDQSAADLAPFREIAERHHGGSMARLIQHHLQSSDPTFYEEGVAIQSMVDSYENLQEAVTALDGSLLGQLRYLVTDADPELAAQTWSDYSPTLVTQTDAIVFAAAAGAALCFVAWMTSRLGAAAVRRVFR